MKKIIALTLMLVMMLALCGVAHADFAPNGPVSMIVAYKAGSGTDNTARVLAKYAEKYVGQTIVIVRPSLLKTSKAAPALSAGPSLLMRIPTARPSGSSTCRTSPAPSSMKWAPTRSSPLHRSQTT